MVNKKEDSPWKAPADLVNLVDGFFSASCRYKCTLDKIGTGNPDSGILTVNKEGLYKSLGLDGSVLTRFRNGTARNKREPDQIKITGRLLRLFKKDPEIGTKTEEDRENRQFAIGLIADWEEKNPQIIRRIIEALEGHLDYLRKTWNHIEGKRLDCLSGSVTVAPKPRELRSKHSAFVPALNSETVPQNMTPRAGIMYRGEFVENLQAIVFSNRTKRILVTLKGPPGAGKSYVIRRVIQSIAQDIAVESPGPGFLHVDLSKAEHPMRAVYLAIRGDAASSRSSFDEGIQPKDVDDGDIEANENSGGSFFEIANLLQEPDPDCGQIVVFERFSSLGKNSAGQIELAKLLEKTPIGHGLVLLESNGQELEILGFPKMPLTIPPFARHEASSFLTDEHNIPEGLARDAIRHVSVDESILYPMTLAGGAAEFQPAYLEAVGKTADSEGLSMSILTSASEIAQRMVLGLVSDQEAATGAIISLMAMSTFAYAAISEEDLLAADLYPIPWQSLTEIGWIDGEKGNLSGFAQDAFRSGVILLLSGTSAGIDNGKAELENAITRLFSVLRSKQAIEIVEAIEESATWLGRSPGLESSVLRNMRAFLYIEAVNDDIPPLENATELQLKKELTRSEDKEFDLDAAIAVLVIIARRKPGASSEGVLDEKSEFLTQLEQLLKVLERPMPITSEQLNAIDSALYHGSRRFNVLEKILDARERILAFANEPDGGSAGASLGDLGHSLISFQINTADLLAGNDDIDGARQLADTALTSLKNIPLHERDSFTWWALSRVSSLRSRLGTDLAVQIDELGAAVEYAKESVKSNPFDIRCVQFLLRMVRRNIEIEGDEKKCRDVVRDVLNLLDEVLGPRSGWKSPIKGQAAALIRRVSRLSWNAETAQTLATEALALLETTTGPDGAQSPHFSSEELLVKVRLYRQLGKYSLALGICDQVIKSEPSAKAWNLYLRVIDEESSDNAANRRGTDQWELQQADISPRLRTAMAAARKWINKMPSSTPGLGGLALWIQKRVWANEGSLLNSIQSQLDGNGIDFRSLNVGEKEKRLRTAHFRRANIIAGIRKAFGNSVGLILAEARELGQYVRIISIATGSEPESELVLEVFDRGLMEFRSSDAIKYWKSDYLRYIWDVDGAIDGFRMVAASAKSGELRRKASFSLARCLHVAATEYCDNDDEARNDKLSEALSLTEPLIGAHTGGVEAAILKEHISLELGKKVNWSALDDMHERIVGKITDFPNPLIKNLDILKQYDTGVPVDISEALHAEFTDPAVLGVSGLLFLRRAEKGIGNRIREDFVNALSFFRAAGVMERSVSGREYPVTTFRIARTIYSASDCFQTVNPVPDLSTGDRSDQLTLAESYFSSVASRTTGKFRDLAREMQSKAAKLGSALREDKN